MADQGRGSNVGADDQEQVNMWSMMLKQARETSKGHSRSEVSTVYFVGNPKCGKTSILNQWKDRVASKSDIPEYVLDYSYVNVKDKFNPEKMGIISRMGIWQLSDNSQAELLPQVDCDANHAAFVIGLDLDEPHSILTSLKKWLKVYKDTSLALLGNYSDEHSASMKTKISEYIHKWEDATKPKEEEKKVEEEKVEEEPEEEHSILNTKTKKQKNKEVKEEEKKNEPKPFDANIPVNNYGIPLFIVGLKADSFEKNNENEKLAFVIRRLRQEALKYGATLIFTSAVRRINVDVLEDQIFHRLFDLPLMHKPITTGTCTEWALHIPAGCDDEKDINSSKFSDKTSMVDVFEYVEERKEETKHEVVSARSDQEFFDSLRGKLGNGRRMGDSRMSGTNSKKKKDKAVKSFFKSLLSGEGQ